LHKSISFILFFYFILSATKQRTENVLKEPKRETYQRWREAFGGVEAFPCENLVAVEDLKEPSHATHLLLQILVLHYPRRHFPGNILLSLSIFTLSPNTL
jgi:hypothetical protein